MNVTFSVSTKYAGSEVKEIFELFGELLSGDYTFKEWNGLTTTEQNDIIQDEYDAWLEDNIDCHWEVV